MTAITTVNPATGETIDVHPHTTPDGLAAALDRAVGRARRPRPASDRAVRLRVLAERLRARSAEYSMLITTEMGKPITQAAAEIEKCAVACEHYADRVPELLAPRPVDMTPDSASVRVLPLGTVLAIMPWNYPFWQVVRSMVPAMAIGDTVILKHADNVTGSARAIEALFDEVFGRGTLTAVVLDPDRVASVIDDPRIAAVAFTGSDRVGGLVAARAGARLKKAVLELGGSDPFIVLADADIPAAARAAVRSRMLNAGQSCIAAKRIIVERPAMAEFAAAAVAEMGRLAVGDPTDPGTDIGPMARTDLRDELRRQLEETLRAGAGKLAGGEPDDRPGAWFTPTLVETRDASCPAFQEETFGPLTAVLAVPSAAAAVEIANASRYGLGCSIWSRDIDRAVSVGGEIAAGSVFVNRISESDPRLPVGGVKASGHGRELGDHGALEFANIQALRIADPRTPPQRGST